MTVELTPVPSRRAASSRPKTSRGHGVGGGGRSENASEAGGCRRCGQAVTAAGDASAPARCRMSARCRMKAAKSSRKPASASRVPSSVRLPSPENFSWAFSTCTAGGAGSTSARVRFEDAAQRGLRVARAASARRRAHDGDGHFFQRRLEGRAARPVDGVFEGARDAVVVLRRGDEQPVGPSDRFFEAAHRLGERGVGAGVRVAARVVKRDRGEALEQLDVQASLGREVPGGGSEERAVVGAAPQAAGHAEHAQWGSVAVRFVGRERIHRRWCRFQTTVPKKRIAC